MVHKVGLDSAEEAKVPKKRVFSGSICLVLIGFTIWGAAKLWSRPESDFRYETQLPTRVEITGDPAFFGAIYYAKMVDIYGREPGIPVLSTTDSSELFFIDRHTTIGPSSLSLHTDSTPPRPLQLVSIDSLAGAYASEGSTGLTSRIQSEIEIRPVGYRDRTSLLSEGARVSSLRIASDDAVIWGFEYKPVEHIRLTPSSFSLTAAREPGDTVRLYAEDPDTIKKVGGIPVQSRLKHRFFASWIKEVPMEESRAPQSRERGSAIIFSSLRPEWKFLNESDSPIQLEARFVTLSATPPLVSASARDARVIRLESEHSAVLTIGAGSANKVTQPHSFGSTKLSESDVLIRADSGLVVEGTSNQVFVNSENLVPPRWRSAPIELIAVMAGAVLTVIGFTANHALDI